MNSQSRQRPLPNPINRAIQSAWLHDAVEDCPPEGFTECWQCHQWRPETQGNENEKCPVCGADWLPF